MAGHRKPPPPYRQRVITGVIAGLALMVVLVGLARVKAVHATIRHNRDKAAAPTASEPPPRMPAVTGLQTISVRAPGEDRARDVWVWRPAVPESSRLPIFYFLHGVPSDPKSTMEEGLAAGARDFVAHGGTPFVLVVPDGNGDHHEDTEWADAADGSDRIESRLINTVIPAVEGAHRRDARHRAIGGFSMGGYGSLNLALRHPDLFGQVASLSGYYDIDDPDKMFGDDTAVMTANRPDKNIEAARRVRVFLSVGAEDDTPPIEGAPQRFKALLDKARIPATLDVRPGTHDWTFVRSALPDALNFLRTGWPHP